MSDTSPSSRTRVPGGWLLLGAIVLGLTYLHVITYGVEAKEPGARWLGLGVMDVDVISVVVLYLGLVIAIRWQLIARPIQIRLRARVKQLSAVAASLPQEELSKRVHGLVRAAEQATDSLTLLDVLFWSRGRESAGWILVDRAEEELVANWKDDQVIARAEALAAEALAAEAEKREDAISGELAARIRAALPGPGTPFADAGRLRALVVEAMARRAAVIQDRDRDKDYHNNKILWFIVVALLSIVLITNILPRMDLGDGIHPPTQRRAIALLLGGAAGGVISRLTQAMQTPYNNQELRLRWMSLFLSPLRGALAGWAGVALVQASSDLKIFALGSGGTVLTEGLGLALLFGLSERYFDELVEQAEKPGEAKRKRNEQAADSQGGRGRGESASPPQVGDSSPTGPAPAASAPASPPQTLPPPAAPPLAA